MNWYYRTLVRVASPNINFNVLINFIFPHRQKILQIGTVWAYFVALFNGLLRAYRCIYLYYYHCKKTYFVFLRDIMDKHYSLCEHKTAIDYILSPFVSGILNHPKQNNFTSLHAKHCCITNRILIWYISKLFEPWKKY